MAHTAYLTLSVLLVAAAKIHLEEQALVAETKQNGHIDKAAGPACLILCLLQALALTSGFFMS
jgi:hypothetical protein